MNKFFVFFAFILLFNLLLAPVSSAEEIPEKISIVALGDSITFGYNLESPTTQSFPFLIAGGHSNVTNISFPGWTSTDLLNNLSDSLSTEAITNADVITLNIGGNDIMQAIGLQQLLDSGQPIQFTEELQLFITTAATKAAGQLGSNVQAMIATIRQTNETAPILLYTTYNPFGPSEQPYLNAIHGVGEQIANVVNNEIILPSAAIPGIVVVDAYDAFNGKQSAFIIPNDIHPTLAGHQALAAIADQALLALKPTDPGPIDITLSTYEETAGPISITISTSDEVHILKWLPGELGIVDFATAGNTVENNSFEVTENGTYTIYVQNSDLMEAVKHVTIENINPPSEVVPPVLEEEEPIEEDIKEEEEGAPVVVIEKTVPKIKSEVSKENNLPGNKLPDTATSLFNYLAFGSLLLLSGLTILLVYRKKVSTK